MTNEKHTAKSSSATQSFTACMLGLVLLAVLAACRKNDRLESNGCTEPEYPNFDPYADMPNGSCCKFVDAGSLIWRGTATDSATGIVVPYMVTRIAGWLEGPCMNIDRRAISSVSDDICEEGVCHVQVGYYGPTLNRQVEAFGIENESGCCLQPIALADTINSLKVTFLISYYAGQILALVDEYDRWVGQDGRFGGHIAADQISTPVPERGIDSVAVQITEITINP